MHTFLLFQNRSLSSTNKQSSHRGYSQRMLVHVPGVLNTMMTSKEKTIKDVRFQLRLMLRHQFRKIKFNPSNPKAWKQTYAVHVALRQAAIYGCNSQLTVSSEVSLLETGFCWTRDRGATVKLAYPKGVLLVEMKRHMDSVSSIIRSIDTGAALEYTFLFAAQNGVTAKCMNDKNKKVLKIPQSHKDVWRQLDHGGVPNEQEIAKGFPHILDSTNFGRRNKRLYFM